MSTSFSGWRAALVLAALGHASLAHAITDENLTIRELTVYKSGLIFAVFTHEAVSGCGNENNEYQFAVGRNAMTEAGLALAFAALSAAAASGVPVDINHDGSSSCFGRSTTVSGKTGTNSPVPTPDIVELATTTAVAPGQAGNLRRTTPTGLSAGDFSVPDGKQLVLQSIQLFPETLGSGRLNVQLVQNALVRNFWIVPQNAPTLIPADPGIVIAPGFSLDIANGAVSATSVRAVAYGYLTDAE